MCFRLHCIIHVHTHTHTHTCTIPPITHIHSYIHTIIFHVHQYCIEFNILPLICIVTNNLWHVCYVLETIHTGNIYENHERSSPFPPYSNCPHSVLLYSRSVESSTLSPPSLTIPPSSLPLPPFLPSLTLCPLFKFKL